MTFDPYRPGYHFTSPVGWINDPLGVTWRPGSSDDGAGGRYELFYQFNPVAPVWAPECRWGQASSPDLVRWADPRTALEPSPEETGCWSGSVVVDNGVPVIVYTSVLADATGQGRVALAHGDPGWRRWTPDPAGPVLPAPPAEQGLAHVRDPFVWRAEEGWRMLLGAGSTDGRPSVLQYTSADLRSWRLDGVLAEPRQDSPDPGGKVWECPQLFRLDGTWALVVSIWDDGPGGVACAVGDYDGHRFTPRSWQRLARDPLYAATAFADSAGRRCLLSWIQEAGEPQSAWAGALSVPWLVGLEGDRVVVAPHPDVDTLRTGVRLETGPEPLSPAPLTIGALPPQADVEVAADPGVVLTVEEAGRQLLRVEVGDEVLLSVPDRPDGRLPVHAGADGIVRLRLLVDAGVVELFSGGAVTAARPAPAGSGIVLRASAPAPGARLHRLVVHGMEQIVG